MEAKRVEQLIAAYLTGSLSESDWAELKALLDGSPEARRTLVEHLLADRLMHETARKPLDVDRALALVTKSGIPEFADRVLSRIEEDSKVESERDSGGRRGISGKKRSTRRSLDAFRDGHGRQYLIPALVAAGLLFGVVLLFSLASSGPSRPGAGRGESARRERETVALREAGKKKAEEGRAQVEKSRKEAEERLIRLREEEKRAEEAKRNASGAQEGDLKKKADEAFAEVVRRRKEEEQRLLRLIAEEEVAKKAAAEGASEPEPREKPPVTPTEAAVAKVGRVQGEAYLVVKGEKKPALTGLDIGAGQGIDTGEASSFVEIRFEDQSRLEMGTGTIVRELTSEGGKRLTVEKGSLRAEVKKQPKEQPMVISTPHGEATVLGTTLRIIVDPDPKKETRLEVEEGKVQLKSRLTGKTVMVESGHYAIAAAGGELAARPTPIDEVLLLAEDARSVGNEWRSVKDEQAAARMALEAPLAFSRCGQGPGQVTAIEQVPSYVKFSFMADAGKEYTVWVRGACLSTEKNRLGYDCVVLQFPGQRVTKPNTQDAIAFAGSDRAGFNGYGRWTGYGWVGGNADLGAAGAGDLVPVTVRFSRSGQQTARLYALEGPLRIDAIWLSTSQKTRPEDNYQGPGIRGK